MMDDSFRWTPGRHFMVQQLMYHFQQNNSCVEFGEIQADLLAQQRTEHDPQPIVAHTFSFTEQDCRAAANLLTQAEAFGTVIYDVPTQTFYYMCMDNPFSRD